MLGPLNRRSPVPLYSQIQEQLRRYILERQRESFAEGPVRFYTDDELAGIFKVSRMTVRQAVQELVNEGLLYRVKGLGTFISPPQVQGQLKEIERFVDEWSVQGKDIRVEVLAHKVVPCPAEWADALQQGPGSPVLYILRRRHADGVPVALDDRYLPPEMVEIVDPEDVVKESIFLTLVRKGGIPIRWADYEIGAKAASRREARLLEVRTGDPLVARRLVIYAEPARPMIVGLSVYRADVFKYRVSVPTKAQSEAPGR